MDYPVQYDLTQATETIKAYETAKKLLESCRSELSTSVYSLLQVTWTGDTESAFRTRYAQWDQAMEYMINRLERTRAVLESISENADQLRQESESLSTASMNLHRGGNAPFGAFTGTGRLGGR